MYLLDTNAIILYFQGDDRLSLNAKKTMENEICYFSIASLWEIAIKQGLGKLDFNVSIPVLWNELESNDFKLLPTSANTLERIKTLHSIHRDPFDRLLVALAQENNLTLITRDEMIPKYNVKTIW